MRKAFAYISALLVMAASCSRESVPVQESDLIPVHLGVGLPVATDTKASLVSGTENAVSTITLLCFNEANGFLGKYPAELTPADAVSGTLYAHAHKDTRTIHFVANKDLSSLNPAVGAGEEEVLRSLVSGASDEVAFWGYYHGTSADEVKTYVNNTAHIIYLLRDRAKVEITAMEDTDIASISWIATHVLDAGYVAPYPFENYWRSAEEDGVMHYYGNSTITPKTDASRLAAGESDMVPSSTPLFLFEDYNSTDEIDHFVKIILKVVYKGTPATTRYHNLVLLDDDYLPLPIVRSHTYQITIKNLPKEIGYATFADALAGEVYSNNQTVSVDRTISHVTNGAYSLEITHPSGTSILYQSPLAGGTVEIPFHYVDADKNNPDASKRQAASDFVATWLEHDGAITASAANPSVSFNTTDGTGSISITLNAIDGTLKHGLLLLQDKKHGLARYVNVYSITQFSLGSVRLSDAGSSHNGFPVYSLSFVLPEDFPASFYPLQLSMASSTLSPFSDASASSASGTFSVEVRSTSGLDSNDSSSAWNYGASTWDYWYNYSIPAPAGTSAAERTVTLYLDDIRSKRGSAPSGVGLYLTIPYFGDPMAVTTP